MNVKYKFVEIQQIRYPITEDRITYIIFDISRNFIFNLGSVHEN